MNVVSNDIVNSYLELELVKTKLLEKNNLSATNFIIAQLLVIKTPLASKFIRSELYQFGC